MLRLETRGDTLVGVVNGAEELRALDARLREGNPGIAMLSSTAGSPVPTLIERWRGGDP